MTIESKIKAILEESKKVEDVVVPPAPEDEEKGEENDDVSVKQGDIDGDGDHDMDDHEAEDEKKGAVKAEPMKSIKEDIDALIDGEDLTEEFKEKAATIFEAAVMNRVKQEVSKLDEAYDVKLVEQVAQIKEGLVEKVDGYLDYIVEQWIKQNEIALENGMKADILEGFVGGLKSLFEEHYIDIPEEKYDVIGSLEEQISSLTTKLDEQVASNVELNGELAGHQVFQIISKLSEGLVETDKEKFKMLAEELEFTGVESFQKKAQTIRESYFSEKSTKKAIDSVITDTPILSEEKAYTAPQMKGYVNALDNIK
jgi:hypothetical protein